MLLEEIPKGMGLSPEGILVPLSTFHLSCTLEARDRHGNLKASITQPARSLVRNFGKFFEGLMESINGQILVDDVGTNRTFNFQSTDVGGEGNPNLLFGSSAAAPSAADFGIGTQFQAAVTTVPTKTEDGTKSEYVLTASDTAATGETLVEIALMAKLDDSVSSEREFCMARDTFSPGITVVASDAYTAKYTFTFLP